VHLTATDDVRERVEWYAREGRAVAPELGGDDVIALGVGRGPRVSEVLHALRDGRLDGRFVDRQAEIRYVRSLTVRQERKG
jgi:tRNA nucleotidyltransferase (CCA-adding enzyme)